MAGLFRETFNKFALYKPIDGYDFRLKRHKYSRQCWA
jgi:hypothetical protein